MLAQTRFLAAHPKTTDLNKDKKLLHKKELAVQAQPWKPAAKTKEIILIG